MKLSAIHKHSILNYQNWFGAGIFSQFLYGFSSPDEFKEIISESFLASLLPVSSDFLVKLIGISDGAVCVLLLLKAKLKYVAMYATLWIIGVMAVIGLKEQGELLEHLGPLAMAIYLAVNVMPINKNSV